MALLKKQTGQAFIRKPYTANSIEPNRFIHRNLMMEDITKEMATTKEAA
jgi:hypothetical protein